ncbi:MAG TPA: hypothetical protein VGM30_18280 [Puia sp.]|jgi:hypothetical protein
MKPIVLLPAFVVLIMAAGGCRKNQSNMSSDNFIADPNNPDTVTLMAKWSLVRDSIGSFVGSAVDHSQIYYGVATDYWDFRKDGKVYIKEGGFLDTVNYQLIPADTVLFTPLRTLPVNPAGKYIVTGMDLHQATIRSSFLPSPGGYFTQLVYLRR